MGILLVHTAAVWMMFGVTWVLQQLNYPLLAEIPPENVAAFQAVHNRRFGKVMAPGVLLTFLTTTALVFLRPAAMPLAFAAANFGCLALIVASAARLAKAAHARLENGFDRHAQRMLVFSNAVRLLAWGLMGLGDLYLLWR